MESPPPTPGHDEELARLWTEALAGRVPVYFAAIPRNLVVPFDPKFDVTVHPAGRAGVERVMGEWRRGNFRKVWVYERDGQYVAADDYVTLEAARRGEPDYLPCWVLGRPTLPGVEDVQGPIRAEDLRKILLGADDPRTRAPGTAR